MRRQERQGLATSRGRFIDSAARSDDIQDRGHDLFDPRGGAMTGGAGSSGAGGSEGGQFNPLSEKEMAKLRRGNIVWNFITAGQYVEMYAREKLAKFTDAWIQWIYVKKLLFNAFRGPEFQRVRQAAKRVSRSIKFRFPSYKRAPVSLSRGRRWRRWWQAIILSFPAKHVIGFCTDSASNYTVAARRFATDPELDIRRITWLPCSTHVCNLMLLDIGMRVVWVKETIIRARALVRFIKSHGAAHTLFRKVSPRVQLVEPVETRFASVFLMPTCLKGRRDALESMLHGDAWARILWDRAHVSQAQWVQQQIRDGEFWQRVQYAILVMSPVHHLLRRMDRGGMMMSVVYEWSQHLVHLMRRVDMPEDMIEPCVSEVAIHNLHMLEPAHVAAHLLNPRRRSLTYYHSLQTMADDRRVVEECYRFLLARTGGDPVGLLYRSVRDQMRAFHSRRGDWGDRDLSDAKAADCREDSETERCAAWWFEHGRAHPELRTIAIRVMHLWTSASLAERDWAKHECVSTARRCKLGFAKLAQLVEIATNLKLASCARQGGGYVLPWVMGTGRGGTTTEEEDEEEDVEPEVWGARPDGSVLKQEIQRQIVAFRDSRPSRARSVRDVFGSRATELRPWLEGGDDVDAAAADDDISDDWTDDDDTPLSRDLTAERVYFTYGGGHDGISVITGDVSSITQASDSSRAGGGGGGRSHSEVRVDDLGDQQPRGGLRHTSRRWERDLETGGGGSRDVDDSAVPEEAVQGEFDHEISDAAAGGGSHGGRRGDEETAGVPEGQDVVKGGGSPSVPEGQDVVMGRGDSKTAGDEGQGAAVCGGGEGGPGGDGDTAGVGGDDGPDDDDDDDHGPEDDPYRLTLVLRDPAVPPLRPDDTAHTFFDADALAHALTDDPFAQVSRKSGKQRAPGTVYSPPPFTV
ncbi:hypothetical protein CBR_g28868 [Chara braunii]|uniref:DUF659 domain-containing protein n=1 Tax=Chara braunii TaxID=69332 RepID=A0A388LAD8_CHABU|nr:hypothetical protein CBR_g28868 [Chara braunii]|eukprot:GBG79152.1 hypothetical protein CBR_g28868 [Chara braunii]